jgi:hypothetical protein
MHSAIVIARARTALDKLLHWRAFSKARDKADRIWDGAKARLDLSSEMASSNRRTRLARNILAANLPTPIRYLEIGSYEGGSIAFIHSLLEGRVRATVIDPFEGYSRRSSTEMSAVEARFRANSKAIGADVRLLRGPSFTRIPELIAAQERFDLIYIDGSHAALDVIADAALCWRVLAPRGLLVFDDYRLADCRRAIDAFIKLVKREAVIIDLAGQAFLRPK